MNCEKYYLNDENDEKHFILLNRELESLKEMARYYFKFLSDMGNDLAMFFNSIKEGKFKAWKSNLILQLEKNNKKL